MIKEATILGLHQKTIDPLYRARQHGSKRILLIVVLTIGSFWCNSIAIAAQYTIILGKFDSPFMAVFLQGKIVSGDAKRLVDSINAATARYTDRRVRAIALDSIGGSIPEALRLAQTIRDHGFVTIVPKGARCTSACVVLFAAGSRKIASLGSYIGVHGASIEGIQDHNSLAMTTAMAKIYSKLGVPASVIGRMVVTPPSEITWLTAHEIEMFPWGVANQEFTLDATPIALSGLDDEIRGGRLPTALPEHQRAGPTLPVPPPPSRNFRPAQPHSAAVLERAKSYAAGFAFGEADMRETNCNREAGVWRRGCLSGIQMRTKLDACVREPPPWDPDVCKRQGPYRLGSVQSYIREWLNEYDKAYTQNFQEWECGNGTAPGNDGCRAGAAAWPRTEARR
jgi:hypothetical protein